jgi:acyl-ACP thioesterase
VLWVHVEMESGRPIPLAEDFWRLYAEAAQGRRVGVRLVHPSSPPIDAPTAPWPLRFADFDLLGHVNNAAYWAVVEEALADRRELRPPYRAELEYRDAIERGADVRVVRAGDADLRLWLVDGATGTTFATARVQPLVSRPD